VSQIVVTDDWYFALGQFEHVADQGCAAFGQRAARQTSHL
jgi:hypothetical protein